MAVFQFRPNCLSLYTPVDAGAATVPDLGDAMYKKILLPVDLAEDVVTAPAVRQAAALATLSGAEIRLLSVLSVLPATSMEFVPPDYDRMEQERARTMLTALSAAVSQEHKLAIDRFSTNVRIGGVYHEILAETKEYGADLIVIGSHQPGLSTYLLGSNAAKVVRYATCSTLVVRV